MDFIIGRVPVVGTEIVVVVARGVVEGFGVGGRAFAEAVSDDVQIDVFEEASLVQVAQTVVTHVLVLTGF